MQQQTRIETHLSPTAALDVAARAVSRAGYGIAQRGSAAFTVPLYVSIREAGGAHFAARVRVTRDGCIVVSADPDAAAASAKFSPFYAGGDADSERDAKRTLRREAEAATAGLAAIVVSAVTSNPS